MKYFCKECSGCPHGKIKYSCKECSGGPRRCRHGKQKQYCKECGGSGLCQGPECETYGNRKYKGHCIRCFVHLFPDEKNACNYKTETAVGDHLKEKFSGVTWVLDKTVQDGCSKRRPDLLDMGTHVVIVEVDKNRHDGYDCTCENRRLMEISKNHHHNLRTTISSSFHVSSCSILLYKNTTFANVEVYELQWLCTTSSLSSYSLLGCLCC